MLYFKKYRNLFLKYLLIKKILKVKDDYKNDFNNFLNNKIQSREKSEKRNLSLKNNQNLRKKRKRS